MNRKLILALGSNLGNKLENLQNAEALIQVAIGTITSKSEYYVTAAWGMTDQDSFLNSAIQLETDDLPDEILIKIQEIEKTLGKKVIKKWGPRVIDIDILFYSDWIIKKEGLKVPHPHIQDRNFVMRPLLDIDKNIIHPKLNKTIEELYLESSDQSEVKKLP